MSFSLGRIPMAPSELPAAPAASSSGINGKAVTQTGCVSVVHVSQNNVEAIDDGRRLPVGEVKAPTVTPTPFQRAQVPPPPASFAASDSANTGGYTAPAYTSNSAALASFSLPPAGLPSGPSPATTLTQQMEQDRDTPGLRRQSQNLTDSAPAPPTAPPPPPRSRGSFGQAGQAMPKTSIGGSTGLSSGFPVKNAWMDVDPFTESSAPGSAAPIGGSGTAGGVLGVPVNQWESKQGGSGGYPGSGGYAGSGGHINGGNGTRDPVRDVPRHQRLSTSSLDDSAPAVSPADEGTGHPKQPDLYVITHPIPDRVLDLQATPSSRRAFFNAALPHAKGSLRTVLTRHRSGMDRLQPKFVLTSESGGFLMAAQKQTGKKAMTPYYIISSHMKDFTKDGEHFLGKFRGNMTCTEYVLYGAGRSPKKASTGADLREEILAIRFRKPGNAPRKMEVVVPRTGEDGVRCVHRPTDEKGRDSLVSIWNGDQENAPQGDSHPSIRPGWHAMNAPPMLFTNHPPVWDERKQTFTINFHGRVRHASSKNFQLVAADEGFEEVSDRPLYLQFGRWDDEVFNLDFAHPLSPLQAFAAALSTFDARLHETLKMTY